MPIITPGATTVGAVQISGLAPTATPIESWLNGCLQGKGFAAVGAPAAVAGNHLICELRNPSGSGKNLWVYSVSAAIGTAGTAMINYSTPPTLSGGLAGYNLLTGLSTSVGRMAAGNQATVPGLPLAFYLAPASTMTGMVQPWIMVLAPNTALTVVNNNVNDNLTVNFFWMEV